MAKSKAPVAIANKHYQLVRSKGQVVLVLSDVAAGIVLSGVELLNPEEKLNYTIAKGLTQDLMSVL